MSVSLRMRDSVLIKIYLLRTLCSNGEFGNIQLYNLGIKIKKFNSLYWLMLKDCFDDIEEQDR